MQTPAARQENGAALSAVDRTIIAQLQSDGRTPFSTLATRLGLSQATVQRRCQQLTDDGYFKIIGVVDPLRWSQGHGVIIGVGCDPAAINDVLQALGAIHEVRFVALVTGTFDVVCELLSFERPTLIEILTGRLSKIPGIRSVNTSWVVKVYKTNYRWEERADTGAEDEGPVVAGTAPPIRRDGRLVDDLDEGIVHLLLEDGRMPYSELAVRLRATESTVRRHTLQLLQSGYLRVVAVGNPFRLGFQEVVLLWMKVELQQAATVVEQLLRQPVVRYLSRVAGAVDIFAEALFPDRAALLAFMDGPLAAIDGIKDVSISFELTVHKRAYVRFD